MKEDLFNLGIKGLIRNSKGQILLLRVNPLALKKTTKPYWDLPGGRIHKGFTVEETLLREIEEEIGISSITDIMPVNMVLSKIRIPTDEGDVGLILAIYECHIDESQPIKLSEEHTEFSWFNPIEAAKLLEVKYPKEFTDIVKA